MKPLIQAIKVTLLMTLLTGFIYPLIPYFIGELFFSHQTNGSLVYTQEKELIGSTLIAQPFTQDKYFHPRPSSVDYNGNNSGASNLSPTSKTLIEAIHSRAKAYRTRNTISPEVPIPFDPLTTSASGLDPHITSENALFQAQRISGARNLPINTLLQLIEQSEEPPFLGLFGIKRVNVLKLNLLLDQLDPTKAPQKKPTAKP